MVLLMMPACGESDPYSGTWEGFPFGPVEVRQSNPGWWAIELVEENKTFYGAEVEGELQTSNGSMVLKRTGDNLELTAAPGTKAYILTKQ